MVRQLLVCGSENHSKVLMFPNANLKPTFYGYNYSPTFLVCLSFSLISILMF